jgi:hypothetical protein
MICLPYVLYHWTNSFNFCANCGSRGHFRTQCSLILNQPILVKDRYKRLEDKKEVKKKESWKKLRKKYSNLLEKKESKEIFSKFFQKRKGKLKIY